MPKGVDNSEQISFLRAIFNLFKKTEVTPETVSTTTTGSIASGYSEILFLNTGAAAATITFANSNTFSLPSGGELNLSPHINRKWKRMSYDATGTTLKIILIP